MTSLSSTWLHLIGGRDNDDERYTDGQQEYEKATNFHKENDSQKRHFTCTGKTGGKKEKEESQSWSSMSTFGKDETGAGIFILLWEKNPAHHFEKLQ